MTLDRIALLALMIAVGVTPCVAQEQPDFIDHGPAAEVYNSRGVAATVDGDGRRVVLTWLSDHRSTTGLLIIDAETGETEQLKVDLKTSGSPFWMLMSSREKWYAHFGQRFVEFDPALRDFTFAHDAPRGWGASFTEDDAGVVWTCIAHSAELLSFDPDKREYTNHGPINNETWPQHPLGRIAYDDAGWIYAGIGDTLAQVAGYNTATGEVRHFIDQAARKQGRGVVRRAVDGQVYANGPEWPWHRLYDGEAVPLDAEEPPATAPIRSASWSSVFKNFPDGSRIEHIHVPDRTMRIRDADGEVRQVSFEYEGAQGPNIQSIIQGPDGALYGCTGHPQRIFRFDPQSSEAVSHGLLEKSGHWNDLAVQRGLVLGAEYMGGQLYAYDVTQPWRDRDEEAPNPRMLATAGRYVSRPHILLAHPDGRHVIMGGTPTYGVTGGGMYIYDLETETDQLIEPTDLLGDHSLFSLVALPDGNLVGGTTIAAGTGGQATAQEGELFIFDFDARKVLWREPVAPGASAIRDLIVGPDGLVYGMASDSTFFVFDAESRTVVHRETLPEEWGSPAGVQGPRMMRIGPDGRIYALFRNAVVRIQPGTFEHTRLAESPVSIGAGLEIVDGRIYFCSGSRIWSYGVPDLQ